MQTTLAPDRAENAVETAPDLFAYDRIAEGVTGFEAVGEAEIAAYREQGYLVVRKAFTPEQVADALQGLTDLIDGRIPDFNWFQFEPEIGETGPTLTGEARHNALRKLMDYVRFEPRLDTLATHPPMLTVLARLLGGTPSLFQDMALLKPPKVGSEKPWHQDHAYFDYPLGTPIVGVWIALDPATLENGCMRVLAGGHKAGPRVHFQVRDWQICDTEMVGKTCVAVPLQPGDCLFFDGLLPHGTPTNLSPQRRRAVQFHYLPTGAQTSTREERLEIFGSEGKNVSC